MEKFPDSPVLIIDDEINYLKSAEFELLSSGITNVEYCRDSKAVKSRLKEKTYSLILLDLIMPGVSGKELLPQIVTKYPEIPVIVITGAFPDKPKIPVTQIATDCMKDGAFDCLNKPIESKDLVKTIRDALNLKVAHREIISLKKSLFSESHKKPEIFSMFITKSEKMEAVFQTIGLLAFTSRPLLIRGETGTGKEFAAQEIHKLSCKKGKFFSFHTTGPDDPSFDERLFGQQEKGSFKEGKLEEARGGTLFIDDVGDLSRKSQEKLLHLLRKKEYFPLGAKEPVDADVRVITATKKNLGALTQMEAFNQDLDFQLKNHEIYIPPLRERKEDIPLLVEYFIQEAAKKIGITPPHISEEAAEKTGIKPPAVSEKVLKILEDYNFPGNTGELKKMVFESVSQQQSGKLTVEVFK